jgi:hypothetical protein
VTIDYFLCSETFAQYTSLPEPRGVWCALQIHATNEGNVPDDLDTLGVVAFNATGQRFEQDPDASAIADMEAGIGAGSDYLVRQ